jgi:endonuclease/exonuclease/phosphatase family metal-dependent hydrolase
MPKISSLFTMIVLAAAGWFFFQNYKIEGLNHLEVQQRDGTADGDGGAGFTPAVKKAPPVQQNGETIRIASFNIQVFGESKMAKPEVMKVLADVVRQFNVVAIQEVRAVSQDILPQFVELINADGRHYEYIIGERLGRTSSKEQYAMIYDAASIEVDRSAIYTVADPDDLLHREPLVAPFRVRGPAPNEAITFTLIDIHTDPDETKQELDALGEVYTAVRNDGRGEDDIILLGDLNVDEYHLGRLGQVSGVVPLIAGVPTNTRGNKTYDNMIVHRASTTEFTGTAAVFDLMERYNLTMDQALEVSDHMPIWAEFSIYEGGAAGRIARAPAGGPVGVPR